MTMTRRILLCTDLDRTLLPNGDQPESPQARPAFRRLAARGEVQLAYVTGRHRAIVEQAMAEWELPRPDYVLADVGSSIYVVGDEWHADTAWEREIAGDWRGRQADDLLPLVANVEGLELQEPEKQNRYKLSFYCDRDVDREALLARVDTPLRREGLQTAVIYSVDEQRGTGLVDVLPARATKRHAIEFLMSELGLGLEDTVFAGDSGNDLPVLVSPIRAVLVANASEELRREARARADELGNGEALYLATGGLRDMNGNYAAGILEGLVHYRSEAGDWF